jgi:Flp pilus assembly protein TadD
VPAPDIETAVALHRAGRLDEARGAYEAILAEAPETHRARHNLGLILMRAGELERAVELLAAANAADPETFPAWAGHAHALIAARRFEAAEAQLASVADAPEARPSRLRLAQAWGLALLEQGRLEAAETRFRQACDLAPDDPHAHAELGHVLLRRGRLALARASLERALALAPDDLAARINLAAVLRGLGDVRGAETAYRRALDHDPEGAVALDGLIALLREHGQAAPSVLAPRGEPDPARSLLALGAELNEAGRFAPSVRAYDAAVALRPDWPLPRFLRSFSRLALCDFEAGWQDYERRLDVKGFLDDAGMLTAATVARLTRWPAPGDLDGKHVLVAGEQGIGDQVMFASVLPDVRARARAVTLVVEARLTRLFAASFPGIDVKAAPLRMALAGIDMAVAMGSLPRLFRNCPADFPGTGYLTPSAASAARWAERLGPAEGLLRVGVSWRGGSPKTRGAARSVTLDQLAPVLDVPGCEFVSLQYGEAAAELEAFAGRTGRAIRRFPAGEIEDFDDLAGLVANLDVVVSVQTSVVHLTGALGKPAFVLLPRVPEWRYTSAARTMPWYGSVRLLRQAGDGGWAPVIARAAQALRDRDF